MFNTRAELASSFDRIYDGYLQSSQRQMAKSEVKLAESTDSNLPVKQYSAQQLLRPLFGKTGYKEQSIGHHPDFVHLLGTENKEFCAITTLFMDIESSTRLGLLFAPEDVFRIKNAFISTAIEIIKAFDGHVHRIMGDAVMAYFGGKKELSDNAAINAINCASVLQLFVENTVLPKLDQAGFDHEFGIRIGLDHGPKEKVMWGAYGFPGMEEVTATSFYVDVASKLQHAAGRNQIMLGQSLRDLLDFPEELLQVKTSIKDGRPVNEPYLKPNLTDKNGKPIDYRQYILLWYDYLKATPLAVTETKGSSASGTLKIVAELYAEKSGPMIASYAATSSAIPKDHWIKYRVQMPYMPRLPYRVRYTVENHGDEASTADQCGNHYTDHIINTQSEHERNSQWEYTSYRGLHYMTVEVFSSGGRIAMSRFGVFIGGELLQIEA